MLKNFLASLLQPQQTFDSYIASVERQIAAGDLNGALVSLQIFVDRIITEPLCTTKFVGSPELDGLCRQIGAVSLRDLNLPTPDPWQDSLVVITTRVQKSGGHTRVIEDFFRLSRHARKILLLTGVVGASDIDFITPRLAEHGVEVVVIEDGDHAQRLQALQTRLHAERPDTVCVFNYNQDAVAIAASQDGVARRQYYYHHADHHLALGVYMDGYEHIDLTPFVFHNCQAHGVKNQRYLPLIVTDPIRRTGPFKSGNAMITSTVANNNKIQTPYFIYYSDVIADLLKELGHMHIHIGQLSKKTRTRIRKSMEAVGVPEDRFIHIPWAASVSQAFQDHQVDFYIASFPYGAGKTLIEAMGCGIPTAVHYNMQSRLLGGVDMGSDATFIWHRPAELLAHLRQATAETLAAMGETERVFFEKNHTEHVTRQALQTGVFSPPPRLKDIKYPTQPLQQALEICQSVTIRHLTHMLLLRSFKFLRMALRVRRRSRKTVAA